MNTLQGSHSVL
uniref:Uncharacterized protein n=1 Tax=Lepeophtheirus salmonis TaxID=72036 RepID=A0A0K2SY86_LEPSM